eukprot:2730078-Prymnesium_polylepis.1
MGIVCRLAAWVPHRVEENRLGCAILGRARVERARTALRPLKVWYVRQPPDDRATSPLARMVTMLVW